MSLRIEELWIQRETEEGKPEWKACTVISLFKSNVSQTIDKESVSSEQMFALCYYPETGEIIESPLNLCVIKRLLNEKTKKFVDFGSPDND